MDFGSFVRFLMVGVINTLVGLAIIFLAKWLLDMGDGSANAVGYSVGIVVSFILNKRWSFGHDGPYLVAFVRFLAVIAVAYLANLATVLLAIEALHINSYVAQTIGIIPYTLLTYVGARFLVFRKTLLVQ